MNSFVNNSIAGILFLSCCCLVPHATSLTTTTTTKTIQRQISGDGKNSGDRFSGRLPSLLAAALSSPDNGSSKESIVEQEKKFKIVTCMSKACSKRRASLGMDSLSTFGAMYTRALDSEVTVEEGPCIGSCKMAPCVSIEHEDFFGTVALEGMVADEFASDAFLNVVTEEDADRVWSCVENAVRVMAEADEE